MVTPINYIMPINILNYIKCIVRDDVKVASGMLKSCASSRDVVATNTRRVCVLIVMVLL